MKTRSLTILASLILAEHAPSSDAATDYRWGYIDRAGDVVIEPQFDQAEAFSEGIAAVSMAGQWGLIDTCGRFVAEPIYRIDESDHGITGRIVIAPEYVAVGRFADGLAPVLARIEPQERPAAR